MDMLTARIWHTILPLYLSFITQFVLVPDGPGNEEIRLALYGRERHSGRSKKTV